MTSPSGRPVTLSVEGTQIRLVFPYRPDLVQRARTLPYASFDPQTKSWNTQLCAQSVDALRAWFYEGLCEDSIDDLLPPGVTIEPCPEAVLRAGSSRRPYIVRLAWRDDRLYNMYSSVAGARWDKNSGAFTYPPIAAAQLAELITREHLVDPDQVISLSDTTIVYDSRTGGFTVTSPDERAAVAFNRYFPKRDVVAEWQHKGLSVSFADSFTREMYRGELARNSSGVDVDGMKLALYSYQKVDVAVAMERTGIAILSSPGVGKTVSAIGVGVERLNRRQINRVITVVPGHLRSQWAAEIERFTGETATVILGDKQEREKQWQEARSSRWTIVHYEILHRDHPHLRPLVGDALLVADEAHRITNPEAKRTKIMRELGRNAAYRIALSGTPLQNDPGEWYSLIGSFVAPGSLGTVGEFFGRYAYPGRFGGYEGARNLEELHTRSAPYYIRRTKAEVAEHLPPLRVEHVALDVDEAYHTLLAKVHRQARDEIAAAAKERTARSSRTGGILDGHITDETDAAADMTATMMLRMLCTSPRLVQMSDRPSPRALVEAGLVPDVDGPKIEVLRRRIADLVADGQRAVIFTSFKKMADLIHSRLGEDGIDSTLFTGDTSYKDREKARVGFTSENGPSVFISTDAGSEGLNLGRRCSTLINVDVPWTASKLEQRANRIHRVDSTHDSYRVINMTLKGTVEDGILRMVEHKADLADAVLGERGGRARTTGRRGRGGIEDLLGDPLLAAVYAGDIEHDQSF